MSPTDLAPQFKVGRQPNRVYCSRSAAGAGLYWIEFDVAHGSLQIATTSDLARLPLCAGPLMLHVEKVFILIWAFGAESGGSEIAEKVVRIGSSWHCSCHRRTSEHLNVEGRRYEYRGS